MKRYQCHKQVDAAKVIAYQTFPATGMTVLRLDDGDHFNIESTKFSIKLEADGSCKDLGYAVRYLDGYRSWSPSQPFESGYKEIA